MAVRNLRLTLGLFFLCAGLGLLALMMFAPDVAAKINSRTRLGIGVGLALVLGGVNLAKWYAGWVAYRQMTTPVRLPLQPDPAARGDEEPNPDFDFGKPDEKPANP